MFYSVCILDFICITFLRKDKQEANNKCQQAGGEDGSSVDSGLYILTAHFYVFHVLYLVNHDYNLDEVNMAHREKIYRVSHSQVPNPPFKPESACLLKFVLQPHPNPQPLRNIS